MGEPKAIGEGGNIPPAGTTDYTPFLYYDKTKFSQPSGLDVAGFTTQGQYLANVLCALPAALAASLASPREQSALKTLVLPGEMGERFKLLLLRKGGTGPDLPGRDFRHRL